MGAEPSAGDFDKLQATEISIRYLQLHLCYEKEKSDLEY